MRTYQVKNPGFNCEATLKPIAKQKLRDMGFTEDQIFEEYRVCVGRKRNKRGYRNRYRWIDIAGISPEKKVAIECGGDSNHSWGNDTTDRWCLVAPFFTEMYHLTASPLDWRKRWWLQYHRIRIEEKFISERIEARWLEEDELKSAYEQIGAGDGQTV